jgi:hypothetical protein
VARFPRHTQLKDSASIWAAKFRLSNESPRKTGRKTPLKSAGFGPKNAVFGAKIDVFLSKNDQNYRKCFALSLPNDFSKLHILMIKSIGAIENIRFFGHFFYFFALIGGSPSRNEAADQETELPFQTPLCAKGS